MSVKPGDHVSDTTKQNVSSRSCTIPKRLMPTIPPKNFGAVQKATIFRSAYPQPNNVDFISGMALKTVLCLVDTESSTEYSDFLTASNANCIRVDVNPNKDGTVSSTLRSIYDALLIVMDATYYPLLIHCNQGRHRTGCVVACLRKMQSWPIQAILEEYETYANPKIREGDEKFIRDIFDPEAMLEHVKKNVSFEHRPTLMNLLRSDLITVDSLVKILASTDGVMGSHLSLKSSESRADSGVAFDLVVEDKDMASIPASDLPPSHQVEVLVEECGPLSP